MWRHMSALAVSAVAGRFPTHSSIWITMFGKRGAGRGSNRPSSGWRMRRGWMNRPGVVPLQSRGGPTRGCGWCCMLYVVYMYYAPRPSYGSGPRRATYAWQSPTWQYQSYDQWYEHACRVRLNNTQYYLNTKCISTFMQKYRLTYIQTYIHTYIYTCDTYTRRHFDHMVFPPILRVRSKAACQHPLSAVATCCLPLDIYVCTCVYWSVDTWHHHKGK